MNVVCVVPMRGVLTPPRVSMPSDSGVTSSRSTSFTSPASTPPYTQYPNHQHRETETEIHIHRDTETDTDTDRHRHRQTQTAERQNVRME